MSIHRAVINTSEQGVVYDFMREGRLFRALDRLQLEPDGQNQIYLYRVDRDDGPFLAMTAPGSLKVYVRAPDSTAYDLVETATAQAFSGDHFVFVLVTDFSLYQNREVRFEFSESTAGAITAAPSVLALKASSGAAGASLQAGTWAIVSAVVDGLGDKRVSFRSTDPAVAMVVAGAATQMYNLGDARPAQGTEFALVIGVGVGAASIVCTALGNETQTDTVAVTVTAAVEQQPAEENWAQLVEDALDGVKLTVSVPPNHTLAVPGGPGHVEGYVMDLRELIVPGSAEDVFLCPLSFSGEVPGVNGTGATYCTFQMLIGTDTGTPFGLLSVLTQAVIGDMGPGRLLLNAGSAPQGTLTVNLDRSVYLRGGQKLILAAAIISGNTTGSIQLPEGVFILNMSCGNVTHHPASTPD